MTVRQQRMVDPLAARLVASALGFAVRTPLHSLMGFGELLAMSELDDDQRRLVDQMVHGADALLQACGRLSTLLPLLAGDRAPEPERFELADLVAEVAHDAGGDVPIAAKVHARVPGRLCGDADALRRVLAELIANAVQHGERPVKLAVDLAGPADATEVDLRFTVLDGGPGLPADQLAALAAEAAVLPADARRIGLYLARRLAERMGGRLVAVQRADGGTELCLSVALRRAPQSVVRPRRTGSGAGRALRVLLVEDNPVNAILARRQLTRLGHDLDSVTGGEAAVAAVLDGGYQVVLMDRHLPDIDGVEATRLIRAAERERGLRRTPVVAVTADASAGHREECLAAGMDGFLTKPLDLGHLGATLTALAPRDGAAEPDVEVDPGAIDRLAAEFDGERSPVAAMVRAYLDELPGRRTALQVALRRGAARQTAAAAEALRASSETVGALGVARACARILRAAEDGDLRPGQDALPDLLDACERTAAVLAAPDSGPASTAA